MAALRVVVDVQGDTMSKGKKRQAISAAKSARKAQITKSGGKSKYAQKRDRAIRGNYAPTSPFYADEATT